MRGHPLDALVASHHRGGPPVGITSVCSAHPLEIEAALLHGVADGGTVLIEATSNQVDQFGGYTGLRPPEFRALVEDIAGRVGFPLERLVLGGDHLGPHRWRDQPAATAMAHAEDLVRSYVAAGYTKLHLDCSYACADDPDALDGEVMAERAARMLSSAEEEAAHVGLAGGLRFVIGTEVPVPGGADHEITGLVPTSAASARATLDQHRAAFDRQGRGGVWQQVMALVEHPGGEFRHLRVVDYVPQAPPGMRLVRAGHPARSDQPHATDDHD